MHSHSALLVAAMLAFLVARFANAQVDDVPDALSLDELYSLVDNATVMIVGNGEHAGFLVDPTHIVAAGHCMENERGRTLLRIRWHDGSETTGRVVRMRHDRDLALIEIPADHDHQPLELATRGDDLVLGAQIVHAGHPAGLPWRIALGQFADAVPVPGRAFPMLYVSTETLPGDSGGPLVCRSGRVHGVLVMGHDTHAYAVPVEYVRELLARPNPPSTTAGAPPVPLPQRVTVTQVPPPAPRITLYGAPWCGACRMAQAWLRQQHFAFRERDASEWHGDSDGGIPVIVIEGPRGRVVTHGFSPASVTQALAQVR